MGRAARSAPFSYDQNITNYRYCWRRWFLQQVRGWRSGFAQTGLRARRGLRQTHKRAQPQAGRPTQREIPMINAVTARNYALAHQAFVRFIPATTAGGGGVSLGALVKDTIADLRGVSSVNAALALFAVVKGGAVPHDGSGGDYVWEAGATDADDGVSRIRPSDFTTAGVWYKQI